MSFPSAVTLLLFFVSSVRFANVWRAALLMVSVMATRPFLRRSLTNASWRSLPLLYALQSVYAIADGMNGGCEGHIKVRCKMFDEFEIAIQVPIH